MSLRQNIREIASLPATAIAAVMLAALAPLFCAVFVLKSDSAFSMWALGLAALLLPPAQSQAAAARHKSDKPLAFALCLASIAAAFLDFPFWGIFMAAVAAVMFFGGRRAAKKSAAAFAIWIVGIANYDSILLAASYPMRVLESEIANAMLQIFGCGASASGTSIFIGGSEIIITTACSGIEHLWVMALFAWIFAKMEIETAAVQAVCFLCIVPIFIFCNAARVFATILCFQEFGDAVFSKPAHLALGAVSIALTMALFSAAGFMLKKLEAQDG